MRVTYLKIVKGVRVVSRLSVKGCEWSVANSQP